MLITLTLIGHRGNNVGAVAAHLTKPSLASTLRLRRLPYSKYMALAFRDFIFSLPGPKMW